MTKTVEIALFLNRENGQWYFELDPLAEEYAKNKCLEYWLKDPQANGLELHAKIGNKFVDRTPNQIGYLYAEIYPKFYAYMRENGMEGPDELLKTSLKLHPDITFCETHENVFTGEITYQAKSCAGGKSSKEELSEYIDRLVRLAAIFEIDIEDPETYKNRKGISDEKWGG
jgi:hypothetical protein